MAVDLYDSDFVAWTRAQAEALRARGAGANALDYDRLAEEIEDVGKSETRAAESLTVQILIHFLKLLMFPQNMSARHWTAEIAAFRSALKRKLSPTLLATLPADLEALYEEARLTQIAQALRDGSDIEPPPACPFTFDDVLGRGTDWTPGGEA